MENCELVTNKVHSRCIQSAKIVHSICIGFAKSMRRNAKKLYRRCEEVRRKSLKSTKMTKIGIQNSRFCAKLESKTIIFSKKWNFGALWGLNQITNSKSQNSIHLTYNHLQPQKVTVKLLLFFCIPLLTTLALNNY